MENKYSTDLELSSSQWWSITDGDQTGLDITGDITIEVWIKLEQLPSVASLNFGLCQKGDDYPNHRGYQFSILDNDKLGFVFEDASHNRSQSYSTGVIVDSDDVGKWVHIAMSYDMSENKAVMYKNGSAVGVSDTETNASAIEDTAFPLVIGANYYNSAPYKYFDGLIDEFRIWDDIRTPTEIVNNYKKELVGNEANLQGYWKFENNGNGSANSNDLTNNGVATFAEDVPFSNLSLFISQVIIF